MLFGDCADEEESQAGSAHLRKCAVRNTVETLEDGLQLIGRNSDSAVLDAQSQAVFRVLFEAHRNIHVITGIFHCIVQNIGYGGSKITRVAANLRALAVKLRLVS